MKKIICIVLTVCLLGAICITFTACTPRDQQLIIRNWGQYMDEDVIKGFKEWYADKTDGGKIKVKYAEYDENETMYNQLVRGKKDFDLVCPSDYMVERLIKEDRLQKLDPQTLEIISNSMDEDIMEFVKVFDRTLEYSMPYIWGTMGILYNKNSAGVNDEMMRSWAALWNTDFKNSIYMKDSDRDVYTAALFYEKIDELNAALAKPEGVNGEDYKNIIKYIFEDPSDAKIAIAKKWLSQQKPLVLDYDVDAAKMEMIGDVDGTKDGKFGMFWSCDAGYVMNGDEGDIPNRNLFYVVPDEGSNVWIDNFVIPKNAGNPKAANLFIQYLCEVDNAYANMDYCGASTAVKDAAELYKADLEEERLNENGFFKGASQEYINMYMDMLFPSDEILARCGLMRDLGDFSDKLTDMWLDVKNS